MLRVTAVNDAPTIKMQMGRKHDDSPGFKVSVPTKPC